METKRRPTGVTVIAILTIIGGILILISGVSLLAVWIMISVAPGNMPITATTNLTSHTITQFFGVFSAILGAVFLAMGIGYLTMFYGLLKGKGWAWLVTIVLLIVGIVVQIVSTTSGGVFNASVISRGEINNRSIISEITVSIITIAINMLVIYYLFRPHVREYFGKLHN
ncbi:MAG: hypothetical protein WA631_16095 [Nitrososphaeraceae archaeon]